MTAEAALHLAKADHLLATAERLLHHGFSNDAARDAYLAAYHAALAYIVDHAGRAAKTHSGAHSQFAQIAMRERRIDEELRAFLPKAFRLKALGGFSFSIRDKSIVRAVIFSAAVFVRMPTRPRPRAVSAISARMRSRPVIFLATIHLHQFVIRDRPFDRLHARA